MFKSNRFLAIFIFFLVGSCVVMGSCGGGSTDTGTNSDTITIGENVFVINGTLVPASGVALSEVADAEVYVIGQQGNGTTSDENGNFTLEVDITIANQSSTLSKPGDVLMSANNPTEVGLLAVSTSRGHGRRVDVTVTGGEQVELDDIVITTIGAISGTATLQNQTNHTGITVYIPGTSFLAMTDASGGYIISNVPEGTYKHLRTEKDGYHYAIVSDIIVGSDQTTTAPNVDLVLSTGVNGQIVINDGAEYSTYLTVELTLATTDDAVLMMISESDTFQNAEWLPMQSTFEYIFDSDGAHTLYIKFADANGLESAVYSDSITIDTNPLVELLSPLTTTSSTLPTLDWSDTSLANATYHVQASLDSDFSTILEESTNLEASQYTLTTVLSDFTTCYWRASIIDEAGTEWNFTTASSFTVDLSTVTLTSPSNGLTTNDTTPSFSWTSNPNAATYTLLISQNSDLSSPDVTQTGITGTTYTLSSALPATASTNYYWGVTPVDVNGVSGTTSTARIFELDTVAPTVTNKSPVDGATGVAVNTTVSSTFNEAMNTSTITTSSFTISCGGSVSGSISFSGGNTIATFTPSSDLSNDTTCTVTKTTAVTDVAGNNLTDTSWSFTTIIETPSNNVILQPGPEEGKDIWTTSVYSYAPGGGGPGGGLDNEWLQVGGWGDLYYILIEFDLTDMPAAALSAKLELFVGKSKEKGYGGTGMYLDRITEFWDWKTQGTGSDQERLWWADRPVATQWNPSELPVATVGEWYSIDITDLYNAWQNGTYLNYGIQLRPVSNDNRWNEFYSSDFIDDPSLRPRLIVEPEN